MNWIMPVLATFSLLSNDLMDINTVSEFRLLTIPGLGEVKASAIVEHRETYGPFLDLSELEYVRGIGPGTVETLAGYVFVDPGLTGSADTLHWLAGTDSLDALLHVYYLDVGQGDAILARAQGGRTLLFDGGPDPGGPVEPAVVFRLRQLGVDTLHVMAFSHPHADHIGGLAAVLRNFTVLEVLDPGMEFSSWVYEDFLLAVMEAGCDYGLLEEGMVIYLSEEVTATVESAGLEGVDLNVNESSALLRIECGGFSTLLTGDIELQSEMALTPGAVPVTVLKVPHHGSLNSLFPPYLRRLRPQAAVFSAGRRNSFGHPHPAVVEFYSDMGCRILRTDTQGTIVVRTDGVAIGISTMMAGLPAGDTN